MLCELLVIGGKVFFLRWIQLCFIFVYYPMVCSRGVRLNSGFFILSFCRSVKESIKESAFERRQELPAGTGAAPLCQPLKFSADYRDVTATLKMKRLRRLCGERRTFAAVAASFRRKRRREESLSTRFLLSAGELYPKTEQKFGIGTRKIQ